MMPMHAMAGDAFKAISAYASLSHGDPGVAVPGCWCSDPFAEEYR